MAGGGAPVAPLRTSLREPEYVNGNVQGGRVPTNTGGSHRDPFDMSKLFYEYKL